MSHLVNGFCVKDITALKAVVQAQCPELELIESKTYRTWITDNGRLVGDHPLPGIYQAVLAHRLKEKGVDVRALAKSMGFEIPENILDLETNPWNLEQQRKLLQNEAVKAAYTKLTTKEMSKDAKYCIRYRPELNKKSAYEIGLVPHPFRKGEYVMLTDFYAQGNGLLSAKGLGAHKSKAGVDSWANELKQSYSVRAAERVIQREMANRNPAYQQMQKRTLPDGRIVIEVKGR